MCEDRSYYVYVIELDSEVMSDARWSEANPNQGSTECYYVGQSAHAPECRYQVGWGREHVCCQGPDPSSEETIQTLSETVARKGAAGTGEENGGNASGSGREG